MFHPFIPGFSLKFSTDKGAGFNFFNVSLNISKNVMNVSMRK